MKVIVPHKAIASDVDLHYLAQATPGFTGADLSSLVRFAMTQALERLASTDDKVTACVTLHYTEILCCFLMCIMSLCENLWNLYGCCCRITEHNADMNSELYIIITKNLLI